MWDTQSVNGGMSMDNTDDGWTDGWMSGEKVSEWVQITTKRLKGVTGVERERGERVIYSNTGRQVCRPNRRTDAQREKKKRKEQKIYAPNST